MTVQETPIKYPFPKPPTLYHPGPEFQALVENQPVARVELPNGGTAWLVTGYHEARQVAADPRFSRSLAADIERTRTGVAKFAADTIFGMDAPEHTRLRKLVSSAFTGRRVQDMRPQVIHIVDELLDGLVAGTRPVDLVGNFSLQLPIRVICDMLGVPSEDQEQFRGWSDSLIGDWGRDPEETTAAMNAIFAYFTELIELKRKQPADDLMTALIAARDDGDRLSEDELVRFGTVLLVAGHETTANQISMSLVTLLAHPEELVRLHADMDLLPAAIDELMRFVQLRPSGVQLGRVTTEEVRLGGVTIAKGEMVLPFFQAANRDPRAFEDANRLDIGRAEGAHLSFGGGLHYCLGAPLARLELQEAFHGMLTRLPGLRLAVPAEELRFKTNHAFYSALELPVTWDDV
jgi:cytochrome P450